MRSLSPILIGEGIRFFQQMDRDISLHLTEAKACRNGMVELCYAVSEPGVNPGTAAITA